MQLLREVSAYESATKAVLPTPDFTTASQQTLPAKISCPADYLHSIISQFLSCPSILATVSTNPKHAQDISLYVWEGAGTAGTQIRL